MKKPLQVIIESFGGAGLIGLHILLGPFLRRWRERWGATEDETRKPLPGDKLVPQPRWGYTHAITIHAPIEKVWPWLVQIGQGRGGFYSYEGLENLIGCDIHNADRILPEFQELKKGDKIFLHPQMPPIPVVLVKPGRYFVLNGNSRLDSSTSKPGDFVNMLWGFYLEPVDEYTTLFLTRGRYDFSPSFVNRLGYGPAIVEPIGFVMERKMMRELKRILEETE